MNNESITAVLFAALDTVVMERVDDGSFKVIGAVPAWFKQFYPHVDSEQDGIRPGEKFPVIENFLIDAEYYWLGNETAPLKSGIWTETDQLNKDIYLEASALNLQERRILLISLGEIAAYKEKQKLIQKSRERSLNYYSLLKEIQKKEILVHCIVHDLAGQLTGIKYCFELLSLHNLPPKATEYLEIGKKQCNKQEILIREILDAFSAEVESLDNFKLEPIEAPDALVCAREVVTALSPISGQNKVNLQLKLSIDSSQEWKVVGEKSRLDRVLSNLIENALRHSPPDSTVTIKLEADEEFITTTVEDQGAGISLDVSKTLFQKFSQGKDKRGRIGLGLYFCRMTIERWGGSIGCSNRPEGGAKFWFRLPKLLNN